MKVKYIDLGLPSGVLWSERSTGYFLNSLGIVPSPINVNELYHNCIIKSNFVTGPNGNKIFCGTSLFYHLIKYGSDR